MKQVILFTGDKFAQDGSGRFAKDILSVGKWYHPVTGKEVVITPERIQRLSANTRRLLEAGNKIPFRDGHRDSVLSNMGEWTGGFIPHKDSLVAICEPKDPKAIEGMKNGSIDGVSVVIQYNYVDSLKNKYDEVITAVDATDFPVVTGQKEFVALSRDLGVDEVYLHESVKLDKMDADGDCMAQHEDLHADLKAKMKDFSKKKAKHGADHAETKAAGQKAQEAAQRLRKQAQIVHDHVQNMTGGPVYYDRSMAPDLAATLEEMAASSRVNWDAVAKALKV